jgi:hypothetical protein
MSNRHDPDIYDEIADAVAEVARLAAQADDPKRNLLRITGERLDRAKRKLAELMRNASWLVLLIALTTPALAQQTRLYGPDGRPAGTATTDSAGSTIFRDARGRTIGRSSTDSGGATTFRDPRGNVTGRAFTPRK